MATPNTTLESALREAAPALKEGAPFVLCQNGLPEDRARQVVGDSVLGCVVGWGATMIQPGVYRRTSSGGLQLGRLWESAPDPNPTAHLLEAAAPTFVVSDLAAIRWSKLAINCVTATLGAIGGESLGTLLKYSSVRRLAMEVFAEVLAVAQACGIRPSPVRGTLEIDKVAMDERERQGWSPSLLYKHLLLLAVGMKFRRMRSSMLYALEHGREIEIDYINGEVVSRGKLMGVPTPVNSALIQTVRDIEKRKLPAAPRTLRSLAALHS
jgi:2-dehydropantoate 2-reductase